MLLNLAVALLILLITLYLATQGMLSALLALATSAFASILAMALLEPLQGIVGGWRPEYARGVTFLLLFFLSFSGTRIAADFAVPRNIKLSLHINRIAGGAIGFFAGLVIVGTMLLGLEMLPINRTPLGFDRFPADNTLQAVDDAGKPILGQIARPANVWFAPDRFVLAIWNGVSGRALGGSRPWASVHPDLSVESYGYRNIVDGSRRALPEELMQVKDAWMSGDALKDAQGADRRPESGKRFVMVRSSVTKSGKPPLMSYDNDINGAPYFFVTASQVRLLTDKNRQYFPIGYLEQGRRFEPLTLDVGYVVDDYVKDMNTVEDWIFQVSDDENPVWFEMKQLARVNIAGLVKNKPSSPLAAAQYPAHGYFKDLSTLTVTFDPKARELKTARVYLLKGVARQKDVARSPISAAHNHILKCDDDMKNASGGWTEKGAPGVPNLQVLLGAERMGQNIVNAQDEDAINWPGLIPLLLLGQITPDGGQNLTGIPEYFDSSVVGFLKEARSGSEIASFGNVDPSTGRVEIAKISPGQHPIIMTMQVSKDNAPRAYYVWVGELAFKAASHQNLKISPDGANSGLSLVFHLDMDDKIAP